MAKKKTRARRVGTKKAHKRAAKKSVRGRKQSRVVAKSPRAKTKSVSGKRAVKKRAAAERGATAHGQSAGERELIKLAKSTQGQRIVLLFVDPGVPQTAGFEGKRGDWAALRARGAINLTPIFSDPDLVDRQLRSSFFLHLKPGSNTREVLRIVNGWREIHWAYEDSDPIPAQTSPSAVACLAASQHLDGSPVGVNAQAAWDLEGGLGEHQICADLEQGWWVEHQRIADALRVDLLCGPMLAHAYTLSHGTSVLGILCGSHKLAGCRGIAPAAAAVQLASFKQPGMNMPTLPLPNTATPVVTNIYDAFTKAARFVRDDANKFPKSAGGVLLIEQQNPENGLPIESLWLLRKQIREETQKGVTVIVPAGNRGDDLDAYKEEAPKNAGTFLFPFVRPGGDDSGSIIVGAASKAVVSGAHERHGSSNFGSRVDCYAWGEGIRAPTLVSGPGGSIPAVSNKCADFAGTSGAAAIIAGVALLLQGIAAEHGVPLGPSQLRDLLSDPHLGTAIVPAGEQRPARIGTMPDLAKVLFGSNGFSARFGVQLRTRPST